MAYEHNDNAGSIFKNDDRQKDTHAEYTGSAKINGVDYWINAWVKRPEGKKPFFSLSFKPKHAPQPQQSTPTSRAPYDDVPF